MHVRIRSLDGLPRRTIALSLALTLALVPGTSAVAQDDGEAPSIVVTTQMLGWLVRELVGDRGDVSVLIQGVDPHAYEPSAREAEAIFGADLIVANGLGLEEGLEQILEQATADGVPIFQAGDHITVRTGDAGTHEDEAQPADDGRDHAAGDPHLWLDPIAMRDVAAALVPALAEVGIDAREQGAAVAASLGALDEEARSILESISSERRKLVTGHESLGYFADRYGFELVGAVVPGLSTQGEASARELAALAEAIRQAGVPVVFSERGTPQAVATVVAEETGATVVELPVEQLPDDGSYLTFVRDLATTVAGALTG